MSSLDSRRTEAVDLSGATPKGQLEALNEALVADDIEAEFYFCGGAVICQAFSPNPASARVSELFKPTWRVWDAAERLEGQEGLEPGWLNRAVEAFLARPGPSTQYLELSHLRVFVPPLQYVLAVKCAAMRLREDFRELDDVRYLLRAMNITSTDVAHATVTRYFAERQLTPETRGALESLLAT